MANENLPSTIPQKLIRDQLVTLSDLSEFKQDLLVSLFQLLREHLDKQPKKWIKSRELRQLLGISNGKLVTMRCNGVLPFTKIGNVIFYDMEDINVMLVKNKRTSTSVNIVPPKRAA